MPSLAVRRKQAEEQARARRRAQILRVAAFGGIVIAVTLAVGYFLWPVLAPKASGTVQGAGSKTIYVQAAMDGFDLREIRIRVGETVTVDLRSLDNDHHTDGGGKHQFAIEELGVNIIAQPLSTAQGTFTPARPGTYVFYCDICCGGKANPTMNGKLIVEA